MQHLVHSGNRGYIRNPKRHSLLGTQAASKRYRNEMPIPPYHQVAVSFANHGTKSGDVGPGSHHAASTVPPTMPYTTVPAGTIFTLLLGSPPEISTGLTETPPWALPDLSWCNRHALFQLGHLPQSPARTVNSMCHVGSPSVWPGRSWSLWDHALWMLGCHTSWLYPSASFTALIMGNPVVGPGHVKWCPIQVQVEVHL